MSQQVIIAIIYGHFSTVKDGFISRIYNRISSTIDTIFSRCINGIIVTMMAYVFKSYCNILWSYIKELFQEVGLELLQQFMSIFQHNIQIQKIKKINLIKHMLNECKYDIHGHMPFTILF